MDCKDLSTAGVPLPEIALGTWKYRSGVEPLRKGIELDAFLIDTAESCGNEPVVDEAVKGIRDQVSIETKVSPGHQRCSDVLKAADQSLPQMKMDYVDLHQLHGPNPTIPVDEIVGAMEDPVGAGEIRFTRASNFMPRELKKAVAAIRRHKIASNQGHYSLVERSFEGELMP